MVREGFIGLDGLYGNLHTGLCRPEELMENFAEKEHLERLTDISINSAMISDVPGWNWGMVTAMVEKGIKYFSSGPNTFDRIGYILKDWGDKPFYWISPSGKEKVLLYIHGKGYSWFHTGLNRTANLKNKLKPGRIHRYLRKLEKQNYPYQRIIIRYNVGSDNGPPDPNLSEIVERWNRQYPQMKISISTTSRAMAKFESEYGEKIPQHQANWSTWC